MRSAHVGNHWRQCWRFARLEPNWTVEDQLRKTQNKRNHRRVHFMFNKSKPGRHKIYAGLAGVAALALVTECTAEETAQEDQPADQKTEQQDTNDPTNTAN